MKLPKFTEAEIDKMAEEFAIENERAIKMLTEFYKSPRFKEVVVQTKMEVEARGSVGDNSYQSPLFGNVNNDEFLQMFYCLFEESISGLKSSEDGESGFWQERVVYEGMEFSQIYGQGTVFIVGRLQ